MKVLVTCGSERGGTLGIAQRIADTLRSANLDVDLRDARNVRTVRDYDAVIVGGALYAFRWHADARRFVVHHAPALREKLVWFFSSGPLDDSASRSAIEPTRGVRELMDHVAAIGHTTFGGRLAPDAHGFIASKMAQEHAGDWRDMPAVESWARDIAGDLERCRAEGPHAVPRRAAVPLPSMALPLALSAFVALTAMISGAVLVARTDGSLFQMSTSLLAHTPFRTFIVPGILLGVVVGGSHAWAVWMHARRHDLAPVMSFVAGGALLIWIAVQVILIRAFSPLQLLYVLLGLAIVARGVRGIRALMPRDLPRPQVTKTA